MELEVGLALFELVSPIASKSVSIYKCYLDVVLGGNVLQVEGQRQTRDAGFDV